jgi:predicted PurR-regulated permease PerM
MYLRNFEGKVFFALVLVITAIFLWMVRGFLMPVFWAAVFAVLFHRLFLALARLLGDRRAFAAAITTILVVFVVLIPFSLIAAAVAQQAISLYQRIVTGQIDLHAPIAFVERSLPRLMALLTDYGVDTVQLRSSIEAAAVTTTQWIAGQALTIGQNIVTVTILFALMLYFLFFFLRDGEAILRAAIRALPMGDEREERLFRKFAEVSRATVKGTLAIAAIQGAIGGLLFWFVGIQAALFWAVIMGILSLLPAVGPALVWGPAAIILFATGQLGRGLVLVVGGVVVISVIDNVLRPILVGRETKMPDYLILLATLGGISMFGLAGFVMGPIIAALFLVMWEMFADEYAPLDSSEPPAAPTAPPDNPPPGAPKESPAAPVAAPTAADAPPLAPTSAGGKGELPA